MTTEFEDTEVINPSPSSLIASLRSMGYSLETAIADLIDNSITAGARNVDIDSPFCGQETKIYILDDGEGMSEERLVEAMGLGGALHTLNAAKRILAVLGSV